MVGPEDFENEPSNVFRPFKKIILWNQVDQSVSEKSFSTYSIPNGGLVREIPSFQGNLGWWNIII